MFNLWGDKTEERISNATEMAKHMNCWLVGHVYLFNFNHGNEMMIPNDERIRIVFSLTRTSRFRMIVMQPNHQLPNTSLSVLSVYSYEIILIIYGQAICQPCNA